MKLPRLPKIEWLPATALAIGSGAGAAAGSGLLPWWTLCFLLFPLLLLSRKNALILCAGVCLCASSGIVRSRLEKRNAALMPENPSRVAGVLTVRDPRIIGSGDLAMPRRVQCDFSPENSEQTIFVRALFAKDDPVPPAGGRLFVTAIWLPPRPSGFLYDGEKRGEPLLSPYGSGGLLLVRSSRKLPGEKGLSALLLPLREGLVKRLTKGVKEENLRSMAARLFFGVSDGADPELKSRFVASGTIHLFAVSGLHVGILAMIFLLIFRFFPFVWRYYLTAALIFLYVLCSGANVPAVRAGAMIICWCILRAHLFYSPGWNILMLAWSLLMFFHPQEAGALGTQYSFVITAALLLFWEKFRIFQDHAAPQILLMPERTPWTRRAIRQKYRLSRFAGALCIAPLAFLSGAPITLARQNLFVPGSIFPNLILPFVTPLLFFAMLFKMIFGVFSSCCDAFGARVMEYGFRALTGIADHAASLFPAWEVAEPAWYEVLCFYAAFFGCLGARRFRTALAAGMAAAILFGRWMLPCAPAEAQVMVFSSMADRPPVLIFRPAYGGCASVLDLPDSEMGALAAQELRRAGSPRCDLFFSGGKSICSAGTDSFSRRVTVETCRLPPGKISAAFRRNCGSLVRMETMQKFLPDPRLPRREADGALVWEPAPPVRLVYRDEDRGRRVRVEKRGRLIGESLIPWSSPPLLWKQSFEME